MYKLILFIIYFITSLIIILILKNKNQYKILTKNIFNNCTYFKHNFNKLPVHNTIFVLNYPVNKIEYAFHRILPTNTYFVASYRAKNFLDLVYEKDDYILLKDKGDFEHMKEKVKKNIKIKSFFIYIEKISSRYNNNGVGRMRTGIISIAKELGITITPIAVDIFIINKKFEIIVGNTEKIIDEKSYIKQLRNFFIKSKKHFAKTKDYKV